MKFEENELERSSAGVRDRGFVKRENRKHSVKFEANEMKRLLRVRDRIHKRVKTLNKTIRQFEDDLDRCREKIDRYNHGVAREAVKDRAKKFLKEKRWYEGQLDMLENQSLKLDRIIFATKGIKEAQQTVSDLKKLNGTMNSFQGDMVGLIDGSNEILESLGRSHNMSDHDIDEEDLMNELDFLEDDPWSRPFYEPYIRASYKPLHLLSN